MRHTTKENKEMFLKALEKTLGIISAACKESGVKRETYYSWIKKDPDFKAKVDELYEYQVDFVEHQLFKKIKAGSERAILFYMKYKGRNRGYANRTELTGADGEDLFKNIEFKFNKPIDFKSTIKETELNIKTTGNKI